MDGYTIVAVLLISGAAIYGVIRLMKEGLGPKDENHEADQPHAGGKA
jgi:hypothetical protein